MTRVQCFVRVNMMSQQHYLAEFVACGPSVVYRRVKQNPLEGKRLEFWKVSFPDYGLHFWKLEMLAEEKDTILHVQQHRMRIGI